MTKTVLITSSDVMGIPAALTLKAHGLLQAVVIPTKHAQRLLPSFRQAGFGKNEVHTVNKELLEEELTAILQQYEPELLIVITFPWKLPESVLHIPAKGCINFHPGLLPKYKGADPIFWQLRNRETQAGVSVHYMTENIDEGPLLTVLEMPIILGENYGIHVQRLATIIHENIMRVIELAKNKEAVCKQDAAITLYSKKPTREELTINWETQTAETIEALVNASNPKYNGAYAKIRGMEMTILEVSPADLNNNVPQSIRPGTIVYADVVYGLVVACMNKQFLKINIVCMQEGYLSGSKLFSIGFQSGEIFEVLA